MTRIWDWLHRGWGLPHPLRWETKRKGFKKEFQKSKEILPTGLYSLPLEIFASTSTTTFLHLALPVSARLTCMDLQIVFGQWEAPARSGQGCDEWSLSIYPSVPPSLGCFIIMKYDDYLPLPKATTPVMQLSLHSFPMTTCFPRPCKPRGLTLLCYWLQGLHNVVLVSWNSASTSTVLSLNSFQLSCVDSGFLTRPGWIEEVKSFTENEGGDIMRQVKDHGEGLK